MRRAAADGGHRIRRRELLVAVGGAAIAWPRALRAQQKALPVIGYLGALSVDRVGPIAATLMTAFYEGLRETGYVEGQNVAIERIYLEGGVDRLPALAADVVDRRVDVIVAPGLNAVLAAKNATSTVPIVFTVGSDPVAAGLSSDS